MDFSLAFLLGLIGSVHCAGMCGPLALALPSCGTNGFGFLTSRLAYNFGRIATYCLLGVVFGAMGQTLFFAGLQRWLSLSLGSLLLLGFFASRRVGLWFPLTAVVTRVKSRMSDLLRKRSFAALTVLGLLNGLLPCGLVYVACAGATATGGISSGLAYMAAFGLGTLPTMLAISLSGKLVPFTLRLKLQKAIPASILVLALLLILRGLSLGIPYVSPDLASQAPCCHLLP